MKSITIWETSDGQRFDNEGEATAHETSLGIEVDIDAFVDSFPPKKAVEYKRVIMDWTAHASQLKP